MNNPLTEELSNVLFYPVEFNTYGLGSSNNISWKFYRDETEEGWRKEYKIFDHLGSVRATLYKELTTDDYDISGEFDYEPFGARLDVTTGKPRLGFIGKEKDKESALGDFGVRKYDEEIGKDKKNRIHLKSTCF